jgi:membrane protease YdiL (CAAX protease family)
MYLAIPFEGGLVFVALGLGWLFRIDILGGLRPSLAATVAGLVAAVPPFVLLLATERIQLGPLERIKELVLETLGPSLGACRWYDVVLLAALAGFGEELLFRGVVQILFERWTERWTASGDWSWVAGLILSNVIFGLLHFVTPTYALLAGVMGIYFGLLLNVTESHSLLTPILAHGLYDYLAFLVLIRATASRHGVAPANQASADPESNQAAGERSMIDEGNPKPE